MVTHVANRGYRVALPDLNVVREMLAIRILLEVEAATQALPHIGPAELEQIKAAQKAFENAVARGSKADQANTNAAFHDEIYRHAPNRSLSKLVVEIRNRVRPGPIALWPSHADLQRSAAHHVDIVAAIEARDIDALVAAVRRHIAEVRRQLSGRRTRSGSFTPSVVSRRIIGNAAGWSQSATDQLWMFTGAIIAPARRREVDVRRADSPVARSRFFP